MTKMLKNYLDDIFNTAKAGEVREESYYPALKSLLEAYATSQNQSFFVTALPKKTEAGNPDFRVLTAKKQLVGYIEAKDIKIDNLDAVESSEQLKRYLSTFPNVILTNFFEFRLYRNGELADKVSIGRPFIIHTLKMAPPVENEVAFLALLEKFFAFVTPRTITPKQLAVELAKRTRFLRDQVIAEELREGKMEGTQDMEAFYEAFKKRLVNSLTVADFSNLFSQTITYGLFAACIDAKGQFTRESAHKHIPPTIGILKDMFKFVSLSADLPKQMEWVIDDIVEVLAACDLEKIISSFYEEGKGRDPIIHFYETFLIAYDPKERAKRGVYYTPEPVVGFITRSINQLLKDKFGKADGFADSSVTVLDPAAGTLTFPVAALRLAIDEYRQKYGGGNTHDLIKGHLLRDFYAFELMMAPYAVGHLKVGLVLKELGYELADDERFKLYLTNTLDFSKDEGETISYFYEKTLAEEAKQALAVKEQQQVMVVMGNPPYSGDSENRGDWILEKLSDYKQVDGKPLGERNPKWLQDDYVKFIRFAQYKIEQNGSGILGFITNHAWLDNPTFRGMRASLLKTFDEIYILDLHGSSLKKEKTPEGGKDENVFDIKAGVAILLGVKFKEMIQATFDTSVSKELKWLEDCSKLEMYSSSVTSREHKKSDIKPLGDEDLETIVWDESCWDKSVWGDKADVLEQILTVCFPSFPKVGKREQLSEGLKHQLRDAMILEGHIRYERGVFVTDDKKAFLNNREILKRKFGVEIKSSGEFSAGLLGDVNFAESFGLRGTKYNFLEGSNLDSVNWQKIMPKTPYYFFVNKNDEGWEDYRNFPKITEIFDVSSVGVVTARDNFVIDESKRELEVRLRAFSDLQNSDDFIKNAYCIEDKPTFNWFLGKSRKELSALENWESNFQKILYRPFDERWIYYHSAVVERTRHEVMQHMLQPNLALLVKRQSKQDFSYVFISDKLTESCVFESAYANNTVIPLYVYTDEPQQQVLLGGQESLDLGETQHTLRSTSNRKSNFKEEFLAYINNLYNPQSVTTPLAKQKSFDVLPEDIFYYIYAVLYSNTYRQKYAEFLKIDFPRVPFTEDYAIFKKLAELGQKLVDLHLLKSSELETATVKFQGSGDSVVKVRRYDDAQRRVYINEEQYFEPVAPEVWNYYIGGYQVLDKWLKDRKGRHLSSEDSKHYCQIASAIAKTIEVQKGIDDLYIGVESSLC